MDPVTHIALGALTGKSAQRLGKRPDSETAPLMMLGVVAALIPDVDIVTFLIDPAYYHAYWHRAYTHSFFMAPFWAVMLAYAATLVFPKLFRFKRDFWLLSGCAFVGVLTHIGADAITAWDMGWLLPLSDSKVSLGWIFIVDPLFTLTILLALSLSFLRVRFLWLAALLLPVLWIAQAIYYKEQTRGVVESLTLSSAQVIDIWPQPYSTTHWKIIGLTETGYLISHIRLSTADSPWAAPWLPDWIRSSATSYRPVDNLTWVHYEHPLRDGNPETSAAWNHPLMEPVRDFMTYPVVLTETMEDNFSDQAGKASEQNCIWFTDLLYRLPQLPSPFQYGLCKTADGNYERQRRPTHYPWKGT